MNSDEGLRKSSTFINQLAVTDKNIADAVEAILGVYLKVTLIHLITVVYTQS